MDQANVGPPIVGRVDPLTGCFCSHLDDIARDPQRHVPLYIRGSDRLDQSVRPSDAPANVNAANKSTGSSGQWAHVRRNMCLGDTPTGKVDASLLYIRRRFADRHQRNNSAYKKDNKANKSNQTTCSVKPSSRRPSTTTM